ncbi:MAG: pirin family protein [Kurthia sp.]|nr:pirin family protein [Candidatus Kurthia equi]
MLEINKIQSIPLQRGEGRNLRYVLQVQDPMENDPFLILADDDFAHNTFADHPHKGMQTITHILEGSLTHYDSKTGSGGRLSKGDFQIMSAGRGIVHNENPDRGTSVRVLQLWVNLSSENKKQPGHYQDLAKADVPAKEIKGGRIQVFAGEVDGVESQLELLTPFVYAQVDLEKGEKYEFPVHAGYNTYVYGLDGAFEINGESLKAFDTIHFEISQQADTFSIEATEDMSLIVFSGEPIKEPVVAQGPFVMNTQQEIQEAFASYRNGTFLEGAPY